MKSVVALVRAGKELDLIHYQHEWMLYGSPAANLIPLLSMFILRFYYKKFIIISFHTVISSKKINRKFLEDFQWFAKIPILFVKVGVTLLTRLFCCFSHRIIVHTEGSKNVLIDEYHVPMSKIIVIPPGVKEPVQTSKDPYDYSGKKILFLGFINPSKGLTILIKAFSHVTNSVRDVKLYVIGEFKPKSYVKEIKAIIKKERLENRVEVVDNFVSEQLRNEYLSGADIIVLPYTKGDGCYYGASAQVGDAITYGKAIIVTDIPQLSEDIINNEEGIVVERGNAEMLAEKIIELLKNDALRKRLGQNLRKKYDERKWKLISKRTLNVYESLIH